MASKRRVYPHAFKVEAVQLVTEQGYSFAQAAKNLGVSESVLRRWKQLLDREGEQAFPGHGKLAALEEQLRQLRQENERLRLGRTKV